MDAGYRTRILLYQPNSVQQQPAIVIRLYDHHDLRQYPPGDASTYKDATWNRSFIGGFQIYDLQPRYNHYTLKLSDASTPGVLFSENDTAVDWFNKPHNLSTLASVDWVSFFAQKKITSKFLAKKRLCRQTPTYFERYMRPIVARFPPLRSWILVKMRTHTHTHTHTP